MKLDLIADVSQLLMLIVCGHLAIAKHYEDGVLGRLALLGISLLCGCSLMVAFGGDRFDLPPIAVWFLVLFALFIARHAFRVEMYWRHGRYTWKVKAGNAVREAIARDHL